MIQTIQGSEFNPEGVLAELLSTFTCIVFIKRRDKKIFLSPSSKLKMIIGMGRKVSSRKDTP